MVCEMFSQRLTLKKVFILILLLTVFIVILYIRLMHHEVLSRHRQGTSQHGNDRDPSHPKQLLFLFSTWTFSKEKSQVYEKIMDTWIKLMPVIQPAVFSNELRVVSKAHQFRWKVHNASELSCDGIPTLRSMFLAAGSTYLDTYPLYGFANADILFDQSLVESVRCIVNKFRQTIQTKPILILAKRVNVNSRKCLYTNVSDLSVLIKAGNYPKEGSSDLFITNSKFPWKEVPALVVGRIAFGMWMVAFARASGITVIDITQTARAVHVTTRAGNMESSGSHNAHCNHHLLRRLNLIPKTFKCGWIDCAEYYSEYQHSGEIRINKRKPPSMCYRCKSFKHDVLHGSE